MKAGDKLEVVWVSKGYTYVDSDSVGTHVTVPTTITVRDQDGNEHELEAQDT